MKRHFTIWLLLSSISIHAGNWYVDNAVVGGAANGTSWANAWPTIGGINWASVQPGDTIYISGGSTSQTYAEVNDNGSGGTTVLHVNKDGTAGSPITISVGLEAGHNGRVILDGQSNTTWIVTSGGNYARITGGASTNLWLVNALNAGDRLQGIAFFGGSGSHQTLDHLVVSNCNNGIYFNGGTDQEICSNRFVGIQGDMAVGCTGGAESFDAVRLYHNYIEHNCTPGTGGPDGIHFLKGASIYNNEIRNVIGPVVSAGGAQHPDSIQCAASPGSGAGNYTKILDNFIHAPYNACLELGVAEAVHDLIIAGNVFVYDNTNLDSIGHPAIMEASVEFPSSQQPALSVSNVSILNNTAIDFNVGFGWEWQKGANSGTPTVGNFRMMDNVIVNCGTQAAWCFGFGDYANPNFGQASTVISNNLIWAGAAGATAINVGGTSTGNSNLVNYAGIASNPQFVSYTPYSTANDLRLQAGSPAIDAGMDTSALVPTDLLGVSRPQGAAVDIGAYEKVANPGGPPVITGQPQGASITNLMTVTLTVAASGSAPLTYQWQRNGSNIVGATTMSLSVSASGDYSVTVSDSYGSDTVSNTATVRKWIRNSFKSFSGTLR